MICSSALVMTTYRPMGKSTGPENLMTTLTFLTLKAKLACHPAKCLLPVEIIERCGLATGPATVELLQYLLPY